MGPVSVTPGPDGLAEVTVHVHVQPGASRSELVGRHGDALRVRVAAPAEAGRANAAVVSVLAAVAGVAPRRAAVTAGVRSRRKQVRLSGVGPAGVAALLEAAGGP